jgi:hypothetical protein
VRGVRHERIGTGQIGASYRLHLDLAGAAEDVPKTLVAKIAAGSPESRDRVKEGFRKEVGFYTHFASLTDVNTPTCWYAAISEDLLSFTLLLEDLAPALPGNQASGCRTDQAVAAVANLAALHAPLWCHPVLHEHAGWLTPMNEASGAFLGDLMGIATEQFVERYAAVLGERDVETLRGAAAGMGRWTMTRAGGGDPFALMHGDYRLDNLMFQPSGPGVSAVDWQTATTGPPVRDLSYFLETSLATEQRREVEHDLVTGYAAALGARGIDYPADRCFEDYRLGMLQGPLITVLGCIYATADPSPTADEMFLVMATRSCAAIRELGTLDLVAG